MDDSADLCAILTQGEGILIMQCHAWLSKKSYLALRLPHHLCFPSKNLFNWISSVLQPCCRS